MKKRLNKKELEELKKTMRYWEKAKVETIKHLYWHIDALEDEVKTLSTDLRKFKQESLFVSHDKKVEDQKKWPSPSCSYEPDDVPENKRGTILNRLLSLKQKGLIGTEQWNLNLKYSKLTHEQALQLIEGGPP